MCFVSPVTLLTLIFTQFFSSRCLEITQNNTGLVLAAVLRPYTRTQARLVKMMEGGKGKGKIG